MRKEKFSGPGENCQMNVTDLAGSLVTSSRLPGQPQKRPMTKHRMLVSRLCRGMNSCWQPAEHRYCQQAMPKVWMQGRVWKVNETYPVYVGGLLFSGACSGHNELWHNQRSSVSYHVVAAWSVYPQVRCWQHFHQELGQEHRQQGSVWYVLCIWEHSVLQGMAQHAFWSINLHDFLLGCIACIMCGLLLPMFHGLFLVNMSLVMTVNCAKPVKEIKMPLGVCTFVIQRTINRWDRSLWKGQFWGLS